MEASGTTISEAAEERVVGTGLTGARLTGDGLICDNLA
jgi:hypothetical protein